MLHQEAVGKVAGVSRVGTDEEAGNDDAGCVEGGGVFQRDAKFHLREPEHEYQHHHHPATTTTPTEQQT